jgi:RNase P/RNase MRP subunit p29
MPLKKSKSGEHTMRPGQLVRTPILLAVGLFVTFTVSMMAQVQSQTTTTKEPFTRIVQVEKGEVVYVSGHDLILKMGDGTIRHVTVPEGATATVDGKQIGIHDVKVGMKLQKTISTTTTPTTITKVDTVTGKVFHVTPPLSVILTLDDGTNQEFKIPEGQKFDVDGQMVDAWGLREGMKVSATKVTETPETVVTQKAKVTGTMPPPPPANIPILFVVLH